MLYLVHKDLVLDTYDMSFESVDKAKLKQALSLGVSIRGAKLANDTLYYTNWRKKERDKFIDCEETYNYVEVDSDGLLTYIGGTIRKPLLLTMFCRGISSNLTVDIDGYPIVFTSDLILPETFSLDLDDSLNSVDSMVFDLTCLKNAPFVSAFCDEYFSQLFSKNISLDKSFIQHSNIECDKGIFIDSVLNAFLHYGHSLFTKDAIRVLVSYSDRACKLYKSLHFDNLRGIPEYARNQGLNLPYINDLSEGELGKLSGVLRNTTLRGIIDTLSLFIGVFKVSDTLREDILQILGG